MCAVERGISEAIARNLMEMFRIRTPIVVAVIGEGGSGGALGIGVGDRILMLEHAIYSVIPPEGCAAILWRDPERKVEAAEALRLTAEDALRFGLIDEIVPEPSGAAHRDPEGAGHFLREAILKALDLVCKQDINDLLAARYEKFRSMGIWEDLSQEMNDAAPNNGKSRSSGSKTGAAAKESK